MSKTKEKVSCCLFQSSVVLVLVHSLNAGIRLTNVSRWLRRSCEAGSQPAGRPHPSQWKCAPEQQTQLFRLRLTDDRNNISIQPQKKKKAFYEIMFHWAIGPVAEDVIKRELLLTAEQWKLLKSEEKQRDGGLSCADTVNKQAVIIHNYSPPGGLRLFISTPLKAVVVLIICAHFLPFSFIFV